MLIECDKCYKTNLIVEWCATSCHFCGASLRRKTADLDRYRSAYTRRPLLPDKAPSSSVFSLAPKDKLDTSIYTKPGKKKYSSDSIDFTSYSLFEHHVSRTPIDTFLSTPRLARETTKISSDTIYPWYKPLAADYPTKVTRTRNPTPIRPRFCTYQTTCREYLWSLLWPQEYFSSRFDRCYCSRCYPEYYKDVHITAGEQYVIPRGWVRFGLYVDNVKAKVEDIWNSWIISYHGTNVDAAKSIIRNRQFLLPGDKCEKGTVIGIRSGHIPNKNQVYTSPTIKYSSFYCDEYDYQTTEGKRYKAKIVLQCRQQPGTYTIQGETVRSGSRRICNIIPNDKIEIFTTVRAAVVPYGLLIKLKTY